MSEPIPLDHPLRGLFRRAVDKAFDGKRELYSPEIAAHLGDEVLPEFVRTDRLFRLRNLAGRRLDQLPEMLEETCRKEGPERRMEVDRYIGDFVLFMSGFFPAAVRRGGWFKPEPMVARVGGILVSFSQPLDYYVAEGRNAYSRAAAAARYFDPPAGPVLLQLGSKLEGYVDLVARIKAIIIAEEDPTVGPPEGIAG